MLLKSDVLNSLITTNYKPSEIQNLLSQVDQRRNRVFGLWFMEYTYNFMVLPSASRRVMSGSGTYSSNHIAMCIKVLSSIHKRNAAENVHSCIVDFAAETSTSRRT